MLTLFDLRGRVRSVKPNCGGEQAQGFINRRIRNVIDRRTWTDCLRVGQILIPNAYNTGTIDLILGSSTVIGHGTGWPVNDAVNTQLANAPITELGFVDNITPASMVGIEVGRYLVIEPETPNNREIVQVTAVGPDVFTAYVTKRHDPNVLIQSSSLAGYQLNSNNYVYTIKAALDPSTLVVDLAWGSPSIFNQSYQIILAYATVTPQTKRLLYAWDPVAGDSVATGRTWDVLNLLDPQRSSTGDPNDLVSMPPNQAGVMRFEIWPWQPTARALNIVSVERWPTLNYDTDIAPFFINPETFIAGAIADALRTRVIPQGGKQDPYYDPDQANSFWEPEFNKLVEEAEQADEGRKLTGIQNYQQQAQAVTGLLAGNWARTHAVPSWTGWTFGGN